MKFFSQQHYEVAFVIVVALLMATVAVGAGDFDLISGNRATPLYDRKFVKMLMPVTRDQRIEGDWEFTDQGLRLQAGHSGRVAVRFHHEQDGRLILLLDGQPARGFHIRVAISDGDKRVRIVDQDPSLRWRRIDLTAAAGGIDEGWVVVEASMDPIGSNEASGTLARIRLVSIYGPVILPNLPMASLMVLAPVLAYVLRSHLRGTGALAYSLGVLCLSALLAQGTSALRGEVDPGRWWEQVLLSQQFDRYYLLPYGVLLGVFAWHIWVSKLAPHLEQVWSRFALAGILAMSGSLRMADLAEVGWRPLDPDTIAYRILAHKMQSPYDTGNREPLWPLMLKVWFWVLGDSLLQVRLLTVCLSLVMVALAYKLFRDYTGRPAIGLLVAALLGSNPYLVSLSLRGLREEAYLIAILAFVYLIFVPSQRWSLRGQAFGLGLAGAAAQLLRFNSYTFLVPLLGIWCWRQGASRWKLLAISVSIIAVFSVPHLVHNYRVFGDPMYSVNLHFAWARNYEFVILKETGCEGCPTREEMATNSMRGTQIGGFEYLFGLHSVEEVFNTTLRGYLETYLTPTSLFGMQTGTSSTLGYAFYVVGLSLVVMSSYRELLVVAVLLANVIPFALAIGIDPRLGIQTAPFITFFLACGVWFPLERISEWWRAMNRTGLFLVPRDRNGLRQLWNTLLRI